MTAPAPAGRLEGLDLARFLAFVGMVIVNFKIVMGAENGSGLLDPATGALEGKAAATFVVLAGIGLGLASARDIGGRTVIVTLKRAAFLLILGLLNSLIFDADILHYYAFYFLFGVLLLPLSTRHLVIAILLLNIAFVAILFIIDYDTGWNWENYTYAGFWTPSGFVRNLFYNGWHPVIPWLGFVLFGIAVGRAALAKNRIQYNLILFGGIVLAVAEASSIYLSAALATVDPELAILATTKPIPPMPLYFIAGCGAASMVIGVCLRLSAWFKQSGILDLILPAARQTLTLYIAHIVVGMGSLEALGMLGNQRLPTAVGAALLFCGLAVVYALLWSRVFRRGPIEALMRKLTG